VLRFKKRASQGDVEIVASHSPLVSSNVEFTTSSFLFRSHPAQASNLNNVRNTATGLS
jgi:hypothetical protein